MMSAYLSRLIQRFSPTPGDGGVALQPFVRSRSPIAAIDQRLGIDESLGHGLERMSGGFDEGIVESPEPMQLQRKAASVPATVPAVVAATPTVAPAPEGNPTVKPSHTSPAHASPPLPAPSPAPAAKHDLPRATELGPRREPMDPGPLFAPFALHYDDNDEAADFGPSPSKIELRTVEKIIERRETSVTPISPPAVAPPLAAQAPTWPAARAEPARSDAPPLAPSQSRPANAPWVAFDRNNPAIPESRDPIHAPMLEPRPLITSRTELRVVPLVVEPRRPEPEPLVPEVEPTQAIAQTDPVQKPAARAHANPALEPTPSSPSSPTPTRPRGKLTIDSISQIGPLARHFPNRRRLRLRFR